LWSALALGLGADLIWQHAGSGEPITVLGPNALGFWVAAQFVLATRGLVVRRNPLAVGFLSIGAAAIGHIVVVAILTARHTYDLSLAWSPMGQLGARLLSSLLTGGAGLVLGVLLMPLGQALGLAGGPMRHPLRR
jgi:hypothetical protein